MTPRLSVASDAAAVAVAHVLLLLLLLLATLAVVLVDEFVRHDLSVTAVLVATAVLSAQQAPATQLLSATQQLHQSLTLQPQSFQLLHQSALATLAQLLLLQCQ